MSDQRRKAQGVPLPPLVAQLRESCEASARIHGGTTYHAEELGIFRAIAAEQGHFLSETPAELTAPPTAEGNEHQVWYREGSATFLKATWAGHFGMKVVNRNDEEPQASPVDYLQRWMLHNELFGDSVAFLGVLETAQGLRLLIEQPAIEGEVATLEQIRSFFESSGWLPFKIGDDVAYYNAEREVVQCGEGSGRIRHPSWQHHRDA